MKKPRLNLLAGLFSRGRINHSHELSPYVIEHPKITDYVCDEMARASKVWANALEAQAEIVSPHDLNIVAYEGSQDITRDLFSAYHDQADRPTIKEPSEVRASRELHRKLFKSFMESEEFQATRAFTRGDKVGAAMAAVAGQAVMFDELTKTLQSDAEQAQRMAEQEQKIAETEEQLDTLREHARMAHDAGSPIPQEIKDEIADQAAQKQAARKALEADTKQMQNSIPARIQAAGRRAARGAKETAEMYAAMPGTGSGERKYDSPDQALRIAGRWATNAYCRAILAKLGRLQRDFRFRNSNKVVSSFGAPVDVELGNNLTAVLPTELLNLAHDDTKILFYHRYAERQLLQYEFEGEAEAGLGQFGVMLDLSGSMGYHPHQNRHIWAKAAVLALLAIAQRERRDVFVIPFSDGILGEFTFLGGRVNLEDAYDFAALAPDGGTAPFDAMQRSYDIFDKHAAFKRADLVVITDGECKFGAADLALREDLETLGVRIHGISIETAPTNYLTAMCEIVIPVTHLAGPSEATNHLVQAMS